MDSISDLPPVTAVAEPHSDNPAPPFSNDGVHPSYPDMITAAIAGLKDRDGSSRQAIAKYIEKEYANLPPAHSNLLTRHLKLMKNQGQLMMVKHSYMLPSPRSVPFQPPTLATEQQYSVPTADTSGFKSPNSSVFPRRKPGRPPKPRPEFGFQVMDGPPPPEIQPYQPQFEHQLGGGQDFPSQTHMDASGQDIQSHYSEGAEPIFASLGLADEGVPQPLPPPENTGVSPKRGRGRPPKAGGGSKSVVTYSGGGGGDVEAGNRGRKRKAGRPKLMSITMVNGDGVKGNIGRPKRIGRPVTVPLSGNLLRPRGRPRRAVSRPVGRPPKQANKGGPGSTVVVTDPHQLVAYQELKSKYDHLQSKAKESLGMVRPYVNSDYAAFGAFQELETLVGTEGDPSSHVRNENPVLAV